MILWFILGGDDHQGFLIEGIKTRVLAAMYSLRTNYLSFTVHTYSLLTKFLNFKSAVTVLLLYLLVIMALWYQVHSDTVRAMCVHRLKM
jgi:hypothetical protein